MLNYVRLAEVFDRGLRDGVETLSLADRELFLIQDFVIDHQMGGLSGYFYNRLPELNGINSTVAAMQKYGLNELAALFNEAVKLFAEYSDPDSPTTWGEVLRRYDPNGQLHELCRKIDSLDNYGFG